MHKLNQMTLNPGLEAFHNI